MKIAYRIVERFTLEWKGWGGRVTWSGLALPT